MNYKKQEGASLPVVVLFLGMVMIVLTIAFKLYPAFYEHWQVQAVMESFQDESGLEDMSVKEITRRFDSRLLTNNVRDLNTKDIVTITKHDGTLYIDVEYQVRIPMYKNIDALISFKEEMEKTL